MLQTTDIYLAAALMSLGAKLDKVNRDDPRHMEFAMSLPVPEFASPVLASATEPVKVQASLDIYEKQWQNGELLVNAVKFSEAIKRMKSVVHSRID